MPETDTIATAPARVAQPPLLRGCDGCTLCCKVMAVPDLEKPAGTWCKHCETRTGCSIYETRPGHCRNFNCGYLLIPNIAPEWKPSISRMVISVAIDGGIAIFVDPGRPDAWRRQPYYGWMQSWAGRELANRRWLVVRVQDRSIVIMPDHAVDLGTLAEDEVILRLRKPGDPSDTEATIYAAKRDAWNAAARDVTLGLRPPMLVEGMRAGRRID